MVLKGFNFGFWGSRGWDLVALSGNSDEKPYIQTAMGAEDQGVWFYCQILKTGADLHQSYYIILYYKNNVN